MEKDFKLFSRFNSFHVGKCVSSESQSVWIKIRPNKTGPKFCNKTGLIWAQLFAYSYQQMTKVTTI